MRKLISLFFIFSFLLLGCKKEDQIVINNYQITNEGANTTNGNDSLLDNKHRILILMYHKLVPDYTQDLYERSARDFKADLNFIAARGYQVLSFDDLIKIKSGTKKLLSDAVVISFDDGYASDYKIAYPKLKEMGMPATFFMVTDWVGDSDRVTWSNIAEMDQYRCSSGEKLFSIESHSETHPFLVKDSSNFSNPSDYQNWLKDELGNSKNSIQSTTGQPNMWLALPYGNGANNPLVISTAKSLGYSGIRTSIFGSFTIKTMDLFALPSLPILSTTDIGEIDNYLP